MNTPISSKTYLYKTISSPIGSITLIADDKALCYLTWGQQAKKLVEKLNAEKATTAILKKAEKQLQEYFARKRQNFDVPLSAQGTEFQKQVWKQLLKIPYGKCISYGEQAQWVGKPKAARAVGSANGRNPIGIIIPCHRVVGAAGALGGYSGGLNVKKKLLALEQTVLA